MSFMPSFLVVPFAIAGLACAAGPIIIHLLNRRRYRVVPWAAMDFLREALQRNRRILQIRDLLLLLLRTVAVLLVGLALAQPFFSQTSQLFDGTKPLHAVLVLDNSMSMGYRVSEDDLLERAKQRAKQYIEKLPADSRVSVIPWCGSRGTYSPDAYTKENALQAVERIEGVDRSAGIQQAINEAKKACENGPLLSKRVVFFSDQQAANWRDLTGPDQFADLPSLQVVDVSAELRDNTWISDLRIQDGLADVETPCTFIVELRHEGQTTRDNLQVTLFVDNVEVASKTVTLEPGPGAREVTFEYSFNLPDLDRPLAVPVRAEITEDRLPADDQRHLVVHVVAALPVVFVDQYGEGEEDAVRNRLGETRHLRRLLAPVSSRAEATRQLIKIRHVKLDRLDQDVLADARLVVLAGLADPGPKVSLLREYVLQGGQLLIGAGGDYDPALNAGFDPEKWTEAGWLDGAGILPVPLKPGFLGASPREQGKELKPFFLSFESLQTHAYFRLASVGEEELRDLYGEPFFFKAVQADVSPEILQALQEAEVKRLDEESRLAADVATRQRNSAEARGKPDPANGQEQQLQEDEVQLRQARPTWLAWRSPGLQDNLEDLPTEPEARREALLKLAERTRPKVLARFADPANTPFLIERHLGRGSVVLTTTGLLSDWNTLPKTNAMLIFDRILRSMIESTLPQRNFPPQESLTLPLPLSARDVVLKLRRPGGEEQPEVLDTGFIGKEQQGFTIPRPLARGLYRVVATRNTNNAGRAVEETVWETAVAVNGSSSESELTPLTREEFETRIGSATVRWIGPEEDIGLAGSQIQGQDSWWWLIVAVLVLLLVELAMLGVPALRRDAPALQTT